NPRQRGVIIEFNDPYNEAPLRPDELQDSGLTGPHHGQGRHHRHDTTAGNGGPRVWDSRQLDFTRPGRNQPDTRTAEGSGMGRLHAWQDAVGSSRPTAGSGERGSVPGLRGEFVRDRRRYRGRRRHEGLVIAGFGLARELLRIAPFSLLARFEGDKVAYVQF